MKSLKELVVVVVSQISFQEGQTKEFYDKIDEIHCTVKNFKCPHDDRLDRLEEKYVIIQKDRAKQLVIDAEKKAEEIKYRAEADKVVAENIASLKSRSKYNLLSMTGYLLTSISRISKKQLHSVDQIKTFRLVACVHMLKHSKTLTGDLTQSESKTLNSCFPMSF
jgi:hypothetical protein